MITICNSAQTFQSSCYHFYQSHKTLEILLLSFRLCIDKTLTKTMVCNCQINLSKFLFGA